MLLQSVNIRIFCFKKKFNYKQLKSFKILKRINTQTYKLKLLTKYNAIYLVFLRILVKILTFARRELKVVDYSRRRKRKVKD